MKLWGGRFDGRLDPLAAELNASIPVDKRLWDPDIRGSVAWARALARAGVIGADDSSALCDGLHRLWAEFNAGQFVFVPEDEDIHTAVERRLGEVAGPVASRLHTGRSRNDQVATDFRLWTMEASSTCGEHVSGLQSALVRRAEEQLDTPMPGYTHMQRAQPVLFSHWLLAHFWALERDRQRFASVCRSASSLPLGSGALAGTAFAIDRERLAQDLGFERVSANSLDAVSDRDFAVEFLAAAALLGIHLSRMAESLIVFGTAEFGFVEMSDGYSTGSSLMPQKKNPDMLELARGKAGALIGMLAGLLATLKGLPSAYDKDLQEDKAPVFAAFDSLHILLPVLAGVIDTLHVRAERMQSSLDPTMLATDLADTLAGGGLPFREAHALAGRAVRRAIELDLPLDRLPQAEWERLSPSLSESIDTIFDIQASLARRDAAGGTAPSAVRAQLADARDRLNSR